MFVNDFKVPCFLHNVKNQLNFLTPEEKELLEENYLIVDKLARRKRIIWKECEILSLKKVCKLIDSKEIPASGLLSEKELINVLSESPKPKEEHFITAAKNVITAYSEMVMVRCFERMIQTKDLKSHRNEYNTIVLLNEHLNINFQCINCDNLEDFSVKFEK